jgi:hypothetical protein
MGSRAHGAPARLNTGSINHPHDATHIRRRRRRSRRRRRGIVRNAAGNVEFVLRCLLAEADLALGVDCYASIAEVRDYGLKRVEYLSTHCEDLV